MTPASPVVTPTPMTLPLLFVDAAPSSTGRYRVGAIRPGSFASSTPSPAYVTTINSAELFAALHGLLQAHKRKCPVLSLFTDSSCAYFDLLRLKCSPSHPHYARMLLRIWKHANKHGILFSLSLIASRKNPADPISRLHMLSLPSALRIACEKSAAFTHVPRTLQHPLWLWWRVRPSW